MKKKFALDQNAIKAFFLQHVEKMVVGLVAIAFLMLVYASLSRPAYSSRPEDLRMAAERANNHIEQTPPDSGVTVVDYPGIASRSRDIISEEPYEQVARWNPPVFPQPKRRTEPKLFPVEKLAAHTGAGSFAMKAVATPAGKPDPKAPAAAEVASIVYRGQRWAVVTGLVPAARQVQAYRESFKDRPRPETDTPEYLIYWVERAEVFGDARDAEPQWVQISVLAAMKVQDHWATVAPELVHSQFIHEQLVFPLGPMMSGWDERVAHPPEIPLASQMATQPTPAAPVEKPSPVPDLPNIMDLPTLPSAKRPSEEDSVAAGGRHIDAEEEHVGRADVTAVQHLLLRFFDFSVEPGRRYSYRVKLLLANPNRGVEARYLSEAKLAEKKWLETPWSEPSPPVFIPRDDRLLAGSVKQPLRIMAEPEASVTLRRFQIEDGTEVSHEFKVLRGQFCNLAGQQMRKVEVAPAAVDDDLLGKPAPSRAAKSEPAGPRIQYRTQTVVVDMRGGERWPVRDRDAVEPGAVLLLDYEGALIVRSELEDLAAVAEVPTAGPAEELDLELPEGGGKEPADGADLLFELDSDAAKKSKKTR